MSSLDKDYAKILEKTAKECSNGGFYKNPNWKEMVLSVFEEQLVQDSLNKAHVPATRQQEVKRRKKDDLDTTAEAADGNVSNDLSDMDTTAESADGNVSNDLSIFVPETQVDQSQRPHSVLSNEDI